MRIIGGELRGRRIRAPRGRGTRPMLDRVREAVFSVLAPWLPGARVLDLFAGSGSLGFEALSRGAASARLVEEDGAAARLLAENRDALGLEKRVAIVRGDALARASWGEAADVVFLDPPYALLDEPGTRASVLGAVERLAAEALAPEGVIVFHVPRGALTERDFAAGFETRERRHGTSSIWFVQPAEEPRPGERSAWVPERDA